MAGSVGKRDDAEALSEPTIFACATGARPSAIAIIRISGGEAGVALDRLTQLARPVARRAIMRALYDPAGELLDRSIVLWLPGPGTVTGEDLVELHCHGGRAVVDAVEATLASFDGLRAAGPGDFTRRAFTNGRIDLSQVEGFGDLLAAETEVQRRAALVRSEGGLRRRVEDWQRRLLMVSARVEAAIDFAEEGDVGLDAGVAGDLMALADEFDAMTSAPSVERLRDGVRVVVAGPPNAGKSSLINALAEREASIVTPIAGTTRDIVEVPLIINGYPIVLADTAGLRADDDPNIDPVEMIGIARAQSMIAQADVVLWLGDADSLPQPGALLIAAKSDLGARPGLPVSVVTGFGLGELRDTIAAFASRMMPTTGLALALHERDAISEAGAAVARALSLDDDVLIAEELRASRTALDRVTGASGTDAMLDALFGRFCIGK